MTNTGLAAAFVLFISLGVKTAHTSTVVTHRHDYDLTSNYHLHDRTTTSPSITMVTAEKIFGHQQSQEKYKGVLNPNIEINKEEDEQQMRRRKRSSTLDTIEARLKQTPDSDPDDEVEREEDDEEEENFLGETWNHPMEPLYEVEEGPEKRKGRTVDGFLGMRGKKGTSSSSGFVGMRGKKNKNAFYGMRGKKDEDKRGSSSDTFYGMRGRRQDDQNRVESRNLKDGFLGMRGKKLSELKRRIQGAFVGMRGKKTGEDGDLDQGSVSPDSDRHVRDVSAFLKQWANQLRRRRMSYDDRMRHADNIFIGMRG